MDNRREVVIRGLMVHLSENYEHLITHYQVSMWYMHTAILYTILSTVKYRTVPLWHCVVLAQCRLGFPISLCVQGKLNGESFRDTIVTYTGLFSMLRQYLKATPVFT